MNFQPILENIKQLIMSLEILKSFIKMFAVKNLNIYRPVHYSIDNKQPAK